MNELTKGLLNQYRKLLAQNPSTQLTTEYSKVIDKHLDNLPSREMSITIGKLDEIEGYFSGLAMDS